jgi:ferrous iron transport protein A
MDHPPPFTLMHARPGRRLRVARLDGSGEIMTRLCSLGILPGTELEVTAGTPGSGCVCVRTRRGVLALGENLRQAIRCEETAHVG